MYREEEGKEKEGSGNKRKKENGGMMYHYQEGKYFTQKLIDAKYEYRHNMKVVHVTELTQSSAGGLRH